MQLMDSHVHVAALNQRDLELMTISNVKAVVAHIAEPDVATNIPWSATFDFVDRMLDFHTWRAAKYFINVHVCACVSMVGIPVEWEETLARLPACVKRPEIVALGEVGLEPLSITCSDLSVQEKILRAQLDIARDVNKTVAIHTPLTEKPKWVDRYLGMIAEHKLERSKVVIDHADATCVNMITAAGCWAAITVQPHRRVRAADAAAMVKSGDRHLVLVDSDSGIPESDSLAVPKTALELRRLGLAEAEIERVLWDNPRKAYGIK
jgi:predicted metal-dependent TIM-barrel fold hydrolase